MLRPRGPSGPAPSNRRPYQRGRPATYRERPAFGRRTDVRPGSEEKELFTRGLLLKVLAAAVVLLLLIISISALISFIGPGDDGDEDGAKVLQSFRDGGGRALVNTSYDGANAYLKIPSGSKIERATLTLSGSLPPQKRSYEAGRNPIYIAASDMDGDILPDVLVVNNNDGSLMLMKNIGGKRFQKQMGINVGPSPMKLLSSDLDNDGFPDAVVLCEDTRDIHIMLNDRFGGFRKVQSPLPFPKNPSDMLLEDMDSDGDDDLAVSTLNDDVVSLMENDGSGMFTYHSNLTAEGNPTRLASADIDMDGLLDLVVSNRQDTDNYFTDPRTGNRSRWFNTVSFFMNSGQWEFTKGPEDVNVQKGVNDIAVGELNGDGSPDLAMANTGYGNVSMLMSDGSGDFIRDLPSGLDVIELVSLDPNGVILADMDGNGRLDLLALSRSADSLLVYRGSGKGSFTPYEQYFVGANPTSMALLDFDLDGDMDIATSDFKGFDRVNGPNGTVSILENLRDGIFGTYRVFPTGTSPRGVFTYDIDGDGDLDISTANYFGSTVSVLKNTGTGRFLQGVEYSIGLEPYAVVMGDFDGDGNIDGASADEANFRLVVLRSDGAGGFTTERFLYDIGAWPYSLRTLDIDKDGDLDLYTSNYFQSSVTILYNGGGSDFNEIFERRTVVFLGEDMPYDSLIADLNGDGLNDLVTVNRGNNIDPTDTVSIMLNDGTYLYKDQVKYRVGREPTSGTFFDMDNDGDLDIATANNANGSVTILRNDGSGSFEDMGEYLVGGRPQFVNSMDRDRDGLLDLVVSCTDTNNLVFLRNQNGISFKKDLDLYIGSFPYAIEINDMDGDLRQDLVITSVNTNNVLMLGCTGFPENVTIDIGADGSMDGRVQGIVDEGTAVELDITKALKHYLSRNKDVRGTLTIPITVYSQKHGTVVLSELSVVYFD
jgi:hypothetical protein